MKIYRGSCIYTFSGISEMLFPDILFAVIIQIVNTLRSIFQYWSDKHTLFHEQPTPTHVKCHTP